MTENEALIRARDVAEILDISTATVLDWFEAGKLPGFRLQGVKGGPVRFRKSEVIETLETWRVINGPNAVQTSPIPGQITID